MRLKAANELQAHIDEDKFRMKYHVKIKSPQITRAVSKQQAVGSIKVRWILMTLSGKR